MNNLRPLIIALALTAVLAATAQTSRKEMLRQPYRTGSNYFAYPGPGETTLTKAPQGYVPFHIIHYARHGSRYMTNNKYYVRAIQVLDSAAQVGLLTEKGKEVLAKLRIGYEDAWHRDGDLTALGALQHRETAHRMFERFGDLLSQPLHIEAKSSTVRRCMLSMFNFCIELQSLNPALEIDMDASKHDWNYVVENMDLKPSEDMGDKQIAEDVEALFKQAHEPGRLMKSLFTMPDRVAAVYDGRKLMEALYNVAEDMQDVPELNISLLDVFTPDELFNMWTGYNAGWLLETGLLPGSAPNYRIMAEVVDSIIAKADRVISDGTPTLTLRFSHDSSVLPLAYMLGLREAQGGTADIRHLYKRISIDKIIPMAANIQLVFYRKDGSDDVLVKFLLNERETTLPGVKTDRSPYYHWSDVRQRLTGSL